MGSLARSAYLLGLALLLPDEGLVDALNLLRVAHHLGPRGELHNVLRRHQAPHHPPEPLERAPDLPPLPCRPLRGVALRVDDGKEGRPQVIVLHEVVPAHVGKEGLLLALVLGVVDRDRAPQNATLHVPPAVGRPLDLVDRPGVPDNHVARLGAELHHIFGVLGEVALVERHKDLVLAHKLVQVALAEVDGGAVVGGGVVHRDPEPEGIELPAVAAGEGAILVVLVPLEPLVGVDHQEVRGDADLVLPLGVTVGKPPAPRKLPEHRRDGRVVEKLCEAVVCGPGRTLDIVVQSRHHPGDGPDVGVGDLPFGDVT
mmetsp:Transcript_6669/g.16095  ORF Transcript_6669/g.16095 Transcript_6669/m.16095 type:complete len:314 (-) Transcript_6669:568-1509(-)